MALVACRQPAAPPRVDLLTTAERCALQDSLHTALGADRTIDDDAYEILARVLPGGFAGFDGSTVLVRPELEAAFREEAARLRRCAGRRNEAVLIQVGAAPVRRGRFDWVQLTEWRRALLDARPTEFYGVDIDERRNALNFSFASDAARDRFLEAVDRLRIPRAAVRTEVTRGGPRLAGER